MNYLLTPHVLRDLGLVVFKPGRSLLNGFHGRMLLMPEPTALQSAPSGQVIEGQWLAADKRLNPFFQHERVLKITGGMEAMKHYIAHTVSACQAEDEEGYHHNMLTVTVLDNSVVRTCWHHDNQCREGSDRIQAAAEKNRHQWVLYNVVSYFRLPAHHQVTWPELFSWSVIHGVSDLLPSFINHRALQRIDDHDEKIGSTTSEHDIKWITQTSQDIIHERVEQVKTVLAAEVDPEPPASFMRSPKLQPWRNEHWLQWVKSQPCIACQRPADDPHHIIGHGQGGMGTKAHDLFCLPLCRACHNELHRDRLAWEDKHGSQVDLLFRFLDRSLGIGAIK
ncbi:DUF968 domain-containing protein [Xenorhabdus sp. 12]|uniref:DUF968 domain-containing protein n=1 Tax=Xenorhabdus santafensis TaxID=2582833 RepID=A0ABU4SAK7_9GAMM|nr:DUF968 domain-containing protein [Xenorhabdus sp. 12]MDX7987843.1 DUF968 domain-containing protein [Xenorhabdus sp. 12]